MAPDSIIEVDRDGSIILCNAATERLFGYRREELLGSPVETLIPEAGHAAHRKHRADYSAHPVTRPMGKGLTLYAQRKDGSRFPVEISLSPVRAEDGFRVTAIIRDVTDRKIAEEQIRLVNQQLPATKPGSGAGQPAEERVSGQHEPRAAHAVAHHPRLYRTPRRRNRGPLNDRQKRFVSQSIRTPSTCSN